MNVAILILAAGDSTRMGSPKQLLPLGDKTMIGCAIENALQSQANKVFCVLGANSEKINPSIENYDIETILNSNYKKGLSSSIVKGIETLQAAAFDAVLIMLADQPNVTTEYINTLIDAYRENPKNIITSKYSKTHGVPAVFPRKLYNQLQQLKGDKGAKTFLNASKNIIGIDTNQPLIDIDTQEDYLNHLNQKK